MPPSERALLDLVWQEHGIINRDRDAVGSLQLQGSGFMGPLGIFKLIRRIIAVNHNNCEIASEAGDTSSLSRDGRPFSLIIL